jgi:hypothetical protein
MRLRVAEKVMAVSAQYIAAKVRVACERDGIALPPCFALATMPRLHYRESTWHKAIARWGKCHYDPRDFLP